jgi:autotransporter translocation and assembly factor TamB
LAGDDWLRRRTDPVTAVELAGRVDVRKKPGEAFRVFGAIRPLPGRSFVQVLGRRFEVTEGAVDLRGPLKDVGVSLHAEYRADSGSSAARSGVLITARVAVDTGRLSMTLGSVPPMSKADMMSYLTTGRPAGTDPTLATDQPSLLATGASLAVGAALGTVAGGAAEKIGVDVVQILQDRKGGQTLVAGKYVSPALYLGFRQPIVTAEDAKHTDTAKEAVEFDVEYAALRRALLNFQGAGNEFRVFLRLRR